MPGMEGTGDVSMFEEAGRGDVSMAGRGDVSMAGRGDVSMAGRVWRAAKVLSGAALFWALLVTAFRFLKLLYWAPGRVPRMVSLGGQGKRFPPARGRPSFTGPSQ